MRYTPLLCLLPLLGGCLATTHRYEDGRLLAPGETDISFGGGPYPLRVHDCDDGYWSAELGKCIVKGDVFNLNTGRYEYRNDTVDDQRYDLMIPRFSLRYRLGVRRQWGPLTGVELGFQTETVTNPVTHDFWLALGLPTGMPDTTFRHAVYGGWGIGAWADNAWFAQYAGSWNWKAVSAFGSWRSTWMATQIQDMQDVDKTFKFPTKRRWNHQLGLGARVAIPKIPIIPDWIGVQTTTEFPQYKMFSNYGNTDHLYRKASGTTFSVAVGWRYAP